MTGLRQVTSMRLWLSQWGGLWLRKGMKIVVACVIVMEVWVW